MDEFNPNALVQEFVDTFEADPPWVKLVNEEAKEVVEAAANLLKEVADLAYVVFGAENAGIAGPTDEIDEDTLVTAVKWGEFIEDCLGDDVLKEAFRLVHASNMSKLNPDGKPFKRDDGKILKGPNYKPADLSGLVKAI